MLTYSSPKYREARPSFGRARTSRVGGLVVEGRPRGHESRTTMHFTLRSAVDLVHDVDHIEHCVALRYSQCLPSVRAGEVGIQGAMGAWGCRVPARPEIRNRGGPLRAPRRRRAALSCPVVAERGGFLLRVRGVVGRQRAREAEVGDVDADGASGQRCSVVDDSSRPAALARSVGRLRAEA